MAADASSIATILQIRASQYPLWPRLGDGAEKSAAGFTSVDVHKFAPCMKDAWSMRAGASERGECG